MYLYMYVQSAPGRAEQEGRKEKTQTNAKIKEKLFKNTQKKIDYGIYGEANRVGKKAKA